MLKLAQVAIFAGNLLVSSILSESLPSAFAREGFSLELASEFVQENEKAALQQFLTEADRLLPPKLKQGVSRRISVRFTNKLGSPDRFVVPSCGQPSDSPGQVRGRVSTSLFQSESKIKEIQLNLALKSEILKGSEASTPYPCGHGNLYRLALATLLHEISHIYDFSDVRTPERDHMRENCRKLMERDQMEITDRLRCDAIVQRPRIVSRTLTFMNMRNWSWDERESRNVSSSRSPDPYEYQKIEEAFGVNMEYFLLDPQFACRRPGEFDYLKDHFGFEPFPKRDCAVNTQVRLTNTSLGSTSEGELVDLDPSRIYQVHYLFASEGPMMMSRWGHAMFRIIVCNKSRKTVGPECMSDIKDHVVISYRANPGNWSVDMWKGLTGEYPSQMFLYRFYPNVVNEYTIDEFRDLISLPLKLSDEEKTRFSNAVVAQHWEYQGKYYFFSNNCATESLQLLKSVIRDFDLQDLKVLTPIDLYEKLSGLGLIDTRLAKNPETSAKNGNLFSSQRQTYHGTFERLRDSATAKIPYKTFDEYVKNTSAEERLALYQELKSAPGMNTKTLANRFYILETFIFRAARNAFVGQAMGKIGNKDSEMGRKFWKMVEIKNSTLPWNARTAGYGIPLTHESASSSSSAASDQPRGDQELETLYREFMDWSRLALQRLSNEADLMASNQQFFLNEMKKGSAR